MKEACAMVVADTAFGIPLLALGKQRQSKDLSGLSIEGLGQDMHAPGEIMHWPLLLPDMSTHDGGWSNFVEHIDHRAGDYR